MVRNKNLEKVLLVIAIIVLLVGVYVTFFGGASIFNIESPTGSAVQPTVMTGMVTVNVVIPEVVTPESEGST
jgi:hypothetical protein